ncbi:hypothetical protein [Rufibacter ruber]|uniref:hypothetical protein n=1 Tax=Rufibacter ruber TaxID=1783499 RepID=UPI0012904C92|nr:hypothetical protein [Rufibacter ruber]
MLRVALIEKAKITSVTGGGNAGTDVTAITLETGALFHEIVFVKKSASYTNELNAKHIAQTLTFKVENENNVKAHSVILGMEYVALVQKPNGKWIMLGQTNGLKCSAFTDNSADEDGAQNFTLSGENLGNAPVVTADVTALINTTDAPAV